MTTHSRDRVSNRNNAFRRIRQPGTSAPWFAALVYVTLTIGCVHSQALAPVQAPRPRSGGLACAALFTIQGATPNDVYAKALATLSSMRLRPWTDTAAHALIVSGTDAPAAMGNAQMRSARLYLELDATPDSNGVTVYVAPGLSNQPSNLASAQRQSLYSQAVELGNVFATLMGFHVPLSNDCVGGAG